GLLMYARKMFDGGSRPERYLPLVGLALLLLPALSLVQDSLAHWIDPLFYLAMLTIYALLGYLAVRHCRVGHTWARPLGLAMLVQFVTFLLVMPAILGH